MRELARREPTFGLHVHVGVPDPEARSGWPTGCARICRCCSRCRPTRRSGRAATPGLASARTPLFQAFPRVGIPRAFDDYEDYVEAVDLLMRCDAFPEPTFLWWDVRPQPRFGTVEVRIMDAQTTVGETAALAALVQSIARLEVEEGYVSARADRGPEVLDENRFLAARDGIEGDADRRGPRAPRAGPRGARRTARGVRAARAGSRLRAGARADPRWRSTRAPSARSTSRAGRSACPAWSRQLADAFTTEGYAHDDAPPGSLASAGPGRSG